MFTIEKLRSQYRRAIAAAKLARMASCPLMASLYIKAAKDILDAIRFEREAIKHLQAF